MKLKPSIILPLIFALALPGAFAAGKEATQSGPSPSPDNILTPAKKEGTTSPTADKPGKDATQPGAQSPTSGAKFAETAAMAGMCEIEMGKLAVAKAASPSIKSFGEMMVTDHTKAADKLKAIAAAQNIELPATLDPKHQAKLDKLSALREASFDMAYVDANVTAHEKAVALFKDAAASCSDAELKAFAAATLPTLEMHLKHILAIQKTL